MAIHPLAVVAPGATIDPSAEIGPFCVIEDDVVVGPGCRLLSHAVLRRWTVLEASVVVHAGAVLGGEPQDLKFQADMRSGVRIGARTVVREGVTVHRATKEGVETRIGADCFLMVNSHIGHDGVVGDGVILVNAVLLAGHVTVERNVTMGGGAMVHQGVRIGEGAMLGGGAGVGRDVPPFCLAAERNRLVGLNLIGLRRRGFQRAEIADIKSCFQNVFGALVDPRARARDLLAAGTATTERGRQFLAFIEGGKRPVMRPRGGAAEAEEGA